MLPFLIIRLLFAAALLIFGFVAPSKADDIVIGFRGKGGAFDAAAFKDHAAKRGLRPVIMSDHQRNQAVELIRTNQGTYELYGYSLGAASVAGVMRSVDRQDLPKPRYIVTVGAFWSTDVDFRRYGVPFKNYFDASGRKQRSPGIHVQGIGHDRIQRWAADRQ